MKKTLLGFLIVAALTGCSCLPKNIETLDETVNSNAQALSEIQTKNKDVQAQLELGQKEVALIIEHQKMIEALEGTGATVTKIDGGLCVSIPQTFGVNESTLDPEIKSILGPIADTLIKYPGSDAAITGHTDSSGSEEYNQSLSEARATSAYNYLVAKSVYPSTLSHRGVGSLEPMDGTTSDDIANRRVDIKIIY